MQHPITPDERMKRALKAAREAFWAKIYAEYHEIKFSHEYLIDSGVAMRMDDANESALKNLLLDHQEEYWAGIEGTEPPFGKPASPSKPSIKTRHVPDGTAVSGAPLTPANLMRSTPEELAESRNRRWIGWVIVWVCASALVAVVGLLTYLFSK